MDWKCSRVERNQKHRRNYGEKRYENHSLYNISQVEIKNVVYSKMSWT
jgi:hypothetical protein